MPKKPVRIKNGDGLIYLHDIDTDSLVFSVADYGAFGDGETDDTSAIQSAIDAAELVEGKVELQSGKNYLISSSLNIDKRIVFDGNFAMITQTTNNNSLYITYRLENSVIPKEGLKITNLRFRCPVTNTASVIKHEISTTSSPHNEYSNIFIVNEQDHTSSPTWIPCAGIEFNASDPKGFYYTKVDNIHISGFDYPFLITGTGWMTGSTFTNLYLVRYSIAMLINMSRANNAFTGNVIELQLGHQRIGTASTGIDLYNGQGNRINGTLWRDSTGTITAWNLRSGTSFNYIRGEYDGDTYTNNGSNNKFDYWEVGSGWATS